MLLPSVTNGLSVDGSWSWPKTTVPADVRCGFALLPISELLPTPGRLHSVEEAGVKLEEVEGHNAALRREIDGLYASLSWRITKPVRLLQRLRRR